MAGKRFRLALHGARPYRLEYVPPTAAWVNDVHRRLVEAPWVVAAVVRFAPCRRLPVARGWSTCTADVGALSSVLFQTLLDRRETGAGTGGGRRLDRSRQKE